MNSVEKRKFAIFRNSCKVYETELERSQKLLFLYPDLIKFVQITETGKIKEKLPVFLVDLTIDPLIIKEYELIQMDILFVDQYLNKIEKLCGSQAKEISIQLFVKQETQEICARDHGMTRDQLQYRMNKWVSQIFGENNNE